MKKIISVLILLLIAVSGQLFTNCETKNETKTNPSPKQLSIAEYKAHIVEEREKWEASPEGIKYKKWMASPENKARMAEGRKKWEASPDGINYKKWEDSPEGKKVHASHDKIRKYLKDFSNMEAVVTSVTFQRNGKSSGIKWLIVSIDGEEYMMQFSPKDFEQLKSLEVNDKITIISRSAGYSPNHPYLILSGDYIARDNKVLFKRDLSKNKGC